MWFLVQVWIPNHEKELQTQNTGLQMVFCWLGQLSSQTIQFKKNKLLRSFKDAYEIEWVEVIKL